MYKPPPPKKIGLEKKFEFFPIQRDRSPLWIGQKKSNLFVPFFSLMIRIFRWDSNIKLKSLYRFLRHFWEISLTFPPSSIIFQDIFGKLSMFFPVCVECYIEFAYLTNTFTLTRSKVEDQTKWSFRSNFSCFLCFIFDYNWNSVKYKLDR